MHLIYHHYLLSKYSRSYFIKKNEVTEITSVTILKKIVKFVFVEYYRYEDTRML